MSNEEVAVMLAEHGKEIGSLKHRVDDVEELVHAVNELALSVKELAGSVSYTNVRMDHYEESLKNQGERIGELEKKPSRRWESLVTVIITALVSGGITLILSNIF
ncbi:MAG: hypothetical protein E7299_07625 [Lachnospiraceae bacterium]|nr:hypothetical protein [Lachnospiraceae bacterium]